MKDIFEKVVHRINVACANKCFQDFDISDLGFKKTDVDDGRLAHYVYNLVKDDNNKIVVDFRCYDQSGPFSMQPDMNKYSAKLIENGKITETHENSFED
ncbi:MAG TPA: hypothetical protein VKZ80_05025 [Flavobacterium sp.]|nr:hypothetical protein [Flavobacterium sp.]